MRVEMSNDTAFVHQTNGEISILCVIECSEEQRINKLRALAVEEVKKSGCEDTLDDGKNILDHSPGHVLAWGDVNRNSIDVYMVSEKKVSGWVSSRVEKTSTKIGTYKTYLVPDCLSDLKLEHEADKIYIDELESDNLNVSALRNTIAVLEADSVTMRAALEDAENLIDEDTINLLELENKRLVETCDRNYEIILGLRAEIKELHQLLYEAQNPPAQASTTTHTPAQSTTPTHMTAPLLDTACTHNRVRSNRKDFIVNSIYDQLIDQVKRFNRSSLRNINVDLSPLEAYDEYAKFM